MVFEADLGLSQVLPCHVGSGTAGRAPVAPRRPIYLLFRGDTAGPVMNGGWVGAECRRNLLRPGEEDVGGATSGWVGIFMDLVSL